jgi:hypothetical protein
MKRCRELLTKEHQNRIRKEIDKLSKTDKTILFTESKKEKDRSQAFWKIFWTIGLKIQKDVGGLPVGCDNTEIYIMDRMIREMRGDKAKHLSPIPTKANSSVTRKYYSHVMGAKFPNKFSLEKVIPKEKKTKEAVKKSTKSPKKKSPKICVSEEKEVTKEKDTFSEEKEVTKEKDTFSEEKVTEEEKICVTQEKEVAKEEIRFTQEKEVTRKNFI